MRPALAMEPTFCVLADGQDAYLPALQLKPLAREHGRYWEFHGSPTTVALPGNRFAKSLDGFTSHKEEPEFRELLREYSFYGVHRPSSYADIFHRHFPSPVVSWSANAAFAPALCGGWQQAISPGYHKGTFHKYDMRSAYLWAASLGLPDTQTYRRSLKPWKDRTGLYRVKLTAPKKGAPPPYSYCHECLATAEEIEIYGLSISEVVDGICWQGTLSGDGVTSEIRKYSTWKQIGRCYWGRWGQSASVTCISKRNKWSLPNRFLNVPWAHTIISRVKMRLWEFASNAIHVYVDSLITPDTIKTGLAIGDWRLEKTYSDGVFIRAPGQYGSHWSSMDRMAGVTRQPRPEPTIH